jgi:hypothetical protein
VKSKPLELFELAGKKRPKPPILDIPFIFLGSKTLFIVGNLQKKPEPINIRLGGNLRIMLRMSQFK